MRAHPIVALSRPRQWYKNLVVFVALVFSGNATNTTLWPAASWTFLAFILLSAGAYCWNDVVDAPRDRAHPLKRQRPVASGAVSPAVAIGIGTLLAGAGVLTLLQLTNKATLFLGAAYLVLQVVYNALFKHHVIWDVLIIGLGFVLRALAGTTAIEVGEPTVWLILCTFLFAVFLALAKRRHELILLDPSGDAGNHRPILGEYTVTFVEQMTLLVAGLLLASYFLYTALGPTPWMMLTIPFALYGVFRYHFLTQRGDRRDETELILRDAQSIVNAIAWVLVVVLVLRGEPERLLDWLQTT